ncbi:hypothetical protein SteCoe_14112 [Stentor coeruleus]|uniref:Uncharacterized protein n=1 Tax=Stentor coeruleus TaxID=5963 RepID=A0A1R2C6S6_9CILI|nr:hypothetical protein SteCoe_14112 [Stentor coeruleus]
MMRTLTAATLYGIFVIHYQFGYIAYKPIVDPYLNRPSLERYKKEMPNALLENTNIDRQIYSSSTDPNIASRLKRR